MSPRILRAHFDGEHIRLDDPYPLHPDTKLLIIVLSDMSDEEGCEGRLRLSRAALDRAYGSNEPEYSLEMIKEPKRESL